MLSFVTIAGDLTALYLGLTISLYMLSIRLSIAGFVARLLASYVALVVCAGYGVLVSILFRPFGFGRSAQWATGRAFKYAMLLATGVSFTIDDPNNYLNTTRPAVFIGNHQTELDVLMLGCIFPRHCCVTAKKSLKNWPFLGWFMALSGTVFIDRANANNARQAMAGAAAEMQRERQSVYMFPEGTRSYSLEPKLLPFKKGAFHLAVQAGVPIVPVVVANYSDVLHVQSYKFRSGTIHVKVLEPIQTKNLTTADVENLTRDTRDLMLKELVSLTSKQRGRPIAMPSQNHNGVVKASGVEATITS